MYHLKYLLKNSSKREKDRCLALLPHYPPHLFVWIEASFTSEESILLTDLCEKWLFFILQCLTYLMLRRLIICVLCILNVMFDKQQPHKSLPLSKEVAISPSPFDVVLQLSLCEIWMLFYILWWLQIMSFLPCSHCTSCWLILVSIHDFKLLYLWCLLSIIVSFSSLPCCTPIHAALPRSKLNYFVHIKSRYLLLISLSAILQSLINIPQYQKWVNLCWWLYWCHL